MNLNTRSGSAWVKSAPVGGDELKELLEEAYVLWTKDTYWLLMPYKWSYEGVNAEFIGAETYGAGREWEVVELTFDGVGLTPQNKYRGFVNPQTGLMEQWYHYRDAADSLPSTVTGWISSTGSARSLSPRTRTRRGRRCKTSWCAASVPRSAGS
jgi:hypothetical protein